jgi:hypothetical protein
MSIPTEAVACTHACAFGCGRNYDVIVVQVADNSTLMLCMPDFVSFAANVAKAMVEPDDKAVREVTAGADLSNVMHATETETGYGIRGYSDPAPEDEFDFDGME